MMPASVSVLPLVSTAPPVVLTLNGLGMLRPSAPAWNMPPSSVTAPVPTELLLVTCNVPALMMVPPV
jgi:hypothetical protein